jgi:holo-[acyl-carrier protein] synthase
MRRDDNYAQYIGVDIIEVSRIASALSRWGERFLHRIYTVSELEAYSERLLSLAARFAAKEAVMKALGTGRRGIAWREIEVLRLPGGRPSVHLHGKAEEKARSLGIERFSISLSHTSSHAIAFVLGMGKAD